MRRAVGRLVLRGAAAARAAPPSCSPAQLHCASAALEGYRPPTPHDERRKKLLNSLSYRAKQRGFLELDLLVGGWAEEHLAGLSSEELAAFGAVLDADNPDLYAWLTGRAHPPGWAAANPAFVKLQQHCRDAQARGHPGARAAPGAAWASGWADKGLEGAAATAAAAAAPPAGGGGGGGGDTPAGSGSAPGSAPGSA